MTRELILYSRHGCHLCDEMVRDLINLDLSPPVRWVVEDVDRRADWRAAYGQDVPVLATADGEIICRHVLDATAVRAWQQRQA